MLTIQEFHRNFRTNDQCLQCLFDLQFFKLKCPKCHRIGRRAFHRHRKKQCYSCNCGKYHFYPRRNTIFAHSSLPLTKWFYAIFLMSDLPNGVSCKELERRLRVTYPTAWRMKRTIMSVKPSDEVWSRGKNAVFHEYILRSLK